MRWLLLGLLLISYGAAIPIFDQRVERFVRQTDETTSAPSQPKENIRCNNESLERVMIENIGDDAKQSKQKVMQAAEALIGGTFNVVCAHGDFSYITSTRLFCLTGNENVKCYAFLSDSPNEPPRFSGIGNKFYSICCF